MIGSTSSSTSTISFPTARFGTYQQKSPIKRTNFRLEFSSKPRFQGCVCPRQNKRLSICFRNGRRHLARHTETIRGSPGRSPVTRVSCTLLAYEEHYLERGRAPDRAGAGC